MADHAYFLVGGGSSPIVVAWFHLELFLQERHKLWDHSTQYINSWGDHISKLQHANISASGFNNTVMMERQGDEWLFGRSEYGRAYRDLQRIRPGFPEYLWYHEDQREDQREEKRRWVFRHPQWIAQALKLREELLKRNVHALLMAKVREHQKAAEDIKNQWQVVEYMMMCKKPAEVKMPLSRLMGHADRCQSSDPRDEVYAFIGLADTRYSIEPAYDVTLNTVRTRLAKALLLVEQDVNVVLTSARANKSLTTSVDPLPSWVPERYGPEDFDSENQRFRAQAGLSLRKWRASQAVVADVSFRDDQYGNIQNILEIKCLYVDTLGKLVHDDYGLVKIFEGRDHGPNLRIIVLSICQSEDEVWIPWELENHTFFEDTVQKQG